MPSYTCDVTIVGAGPAGCAAAFDLRAAGLSVALLDQAAFPRDKVCAGGLTIKAVHALPWRIPGLVRRECCRLRVGLALERGRVFESRWPVTVMTERRELDAFAVDRCLEVGVVFHVIGRITGIRRDAGDWCVETDAGVFRSRHLIGADGAMSRVRRLLGMARHVRPALAVESRVSVADPGAFEMELDFGYVDNGYAWIFPKRDHLNVGLYALSAVPAARERLRQFCRERLGMEPTARIRAHPIPVDGQHFRHRPQAPLLVGDAAGLADPLTGEGIYNAVRSARLAARCIADMHAGKPDRYDRCIREITADLQTSAFAAKVFYGNLTRSYRHLCLPPIRYSLMKGYALGRTLRWMTRRAPLLPFLRVPRQP